MAWQEITEAEIETGEPVSSHTAQKVKQNLELLEERTTGLEGGSATVYPPIIMRVDGTYGEPGDLQMPALGVLKTTVNFNLRITGVRILIDKAGISGVTEGDLKVKRAGVPGYSSILTSKPSVESALGDDAVSANAELDPGLSVIYAGDIIRLDILQAQLRAVGMMVRIDYVKL